ncbi:MAG: TetR/AcrR family transcriptional regulator [Elusimicrobiaceae bacterium]|nr:TetR/AcrR family transcriptional regulator [Elusimicrobiaceae bacterium]
MSSAEENLKPREIREKLLHAAFELIAEKGIDAVSVREIVERVNVSKPVLYYYFKDKEDLCAQLFAEVKIHVDELYAERKASGLSLREIIEGKFRHEIEDMRRTPQISKLIIRTIGNDNRDRLGQLLCDIQNTGRNMMLKILGEAEANGEIRKGSAQTIEFMVHAVSLNLLFMSSHGKMSDIPGDFPERMTQLILNGVQP